MQLYFHQTKINWAALEHQGQSFTVNSASGDSANGDAGDDSSRDQGGGTGTQTLVKPEPILKEPSFYKVILLNDDFTPMDFVVHVLQKFFNKNIDDANKVMMQVHQQGSGIAGVFSHEIAETKVYLVNDYAKRNQHPLKSVMEKDA